MNQLKWTIGDFMDLCMRMQGRREKIKEKTDLTPEDCMVDWLVL